MIGILGGTFDPIHNGHLHIATQVYQRLELEQLQFMPCALPVHRGAPRADAAERCRMIELALEDQPQFVLNRLEIDRQGPSYTIDSLREIHRHQPLQLALLLGSDAFNGFGSWKQPRQILELAHLVVCVRPGIEIDDGLFAEHRADSIDDLLAAASGRILLLEVDAPDCSSSEVRAALARGDIPRRWLPAAVADYIETHQLYRSYGD